MKFRHAFIPSVTALALGAIVAGCGFASAAVMNFDDLVVPPGGVISLSTYTQNGLTLTPTATGAPIPSTHFDADSLFPSPGVAAEMHKGNDAESAKVEFNGGNFNLRSVDIILWGLVSPDTSLTLTFTGSNGSTHDV